MPDHRQSFDPLTRSIDGGDFADHLLHDARLVLERAEPDGRQNPVGSESLRQFAYALAEGAVANG